MRLVLLLLLLMGMVGSAGAAPLTKSSPLVITAWRVEGTSLAPIEKLIEHMGQKGWRIGGRSLWVVDTRLVEEGFSQSFVVEKNPLLFRPAGWLPDKVARMSEQLGTPAVASFRMRVREEFDETVDIQLAAGAPQPTVVRLKWDKKIPGTSNYLVVTTAGDAPVCEAASRPGHPAVTIDCRGVDRLWFSRGSMMVVPIPQEDGSWLVVAFEQEGLRWP